MIYETKASQFQWRRKKDQVMSMKERERERELLSFSFNKKRGDVIFLQALEFETMLRGSRGHVS